MAQIYNFSAGPAVLPASVIRQVQSELVSYKNSGMSIMEISHRSSLYTDMEAEAEKNLRKLMSIPDEYDVLFLQGGGTLQFAMVPFNLARKNKRAGFIDTGHWAQRAIEEARLVPEIKADIVASASSTNYTTLPDVPNLEKEYDYVHLTLNNTIEGTMYRELPNALNGQILVGDMSSNIMAQRYNVGDFGLIYAGAQKNIGPAGMTVVIVKHELLDDRPELPAMLSYVKQAAKHSALNTPPVFAIYVAGLVFKWLLDQGGVDEMQKRNEKKAEFLYNYLDSSRLFSAPVKKDARSITNIPFVTGNEELDQRFIVAAQENGLVNLKGHRSVGGMRASLYNAFPFEGVQKLVEFMEKFEQSVGGNR
ncbi:3-phosphoserine phosphohydroxythreonine aminotransferase [Liquorilactobacillus aquaticus DSM 21051]|uniref:Phosphoserine aminotransferase n=1 Tax=Liquorilactobacillus aquaticus DSM 21051 TaxID=1423725 RepID=A0A0R2D9K6_9LACO|nr:3-phosphoserine/phosphohydroxythreonine transaminase [Liquorilactobacillus aquaticus]KRM97291.1 3-phosphoserine phosphohydroxythreonine aminotransferase [Liquorilactobacillus aquaticus DSM 21051]